MCPAPSAIVQGSYAESELFFSGTPRSRSHRFTFIPGSCPVQRQSYLQPLSSFTGATGVRGLAQGPSVVECQWSKQFPSLLPHRLNLSVRGFIQRPSNHKFAKGTTESIVTGNITFGIGCALVIKANHSVVGTIYRSLVYQWGNVQSSKISRQYQTQPQPCCCSTRPMESLYIKLYNFLTRPLHSNVNSLSFNREREREREREILRQ